MASIILDLRIILAISIVSYFGVHGKLSDNEVKNLEFTKKINDGGAMLFADELKQVLDRYLFGICPQNFKISLGRGKNATHLGCDLDADHQDLAGRLATLSLRVHSAARSDCSRLAAALANTFGELARTAAHRQPLSSAAAAAANEANKKRKLSKSQKAKLQAKQRTALAVKKKAAAMAAAASSKVTATS